MIHVKNIKENMESREKYKQKKIRVLYKVNVGVIEDFWKKWEVLWLTEIIDLYTLYMV